MKTIYTMFKIHTLLNKDVSNLTCLDSLDGMNGFFLYYSTTMNKNSMYRDDYCYRYKENETDLFSIHFFTQLENNKIIIKKIAIY